MNKKSIKKFTQKYKKKTYRKYNGGYIEPPSKIKPNYSLTNPKVNAEESGSPYQRINNKLQTHNENQANVNKRLGGTHPNTNNSSGGGRNKINFIPCIIIF